MPTRKTAPNHPSTCGIVTLTTDFGLQDWFVGVLKGVMLERNPDLRLIDITHNIPAGDIRSGAFCLMNSWAFCPVGTVHLAIVDPGVGGKRRAIALEADGRFYVGPDNGLVSWAIRKSPSVKVREITNRSLCRTPVSSTFHGRDIFAPVAAFLSAGGPLNALGPVLKSWVKLPWPAVRNIQGELCGQVLHIDRFGNAITNLPAVQNGFSAYRLRIKGRRRELPLVRCYSEIPSDAAAAVSASTGFLEVAINMGSASAALGIKTGDRVHLWSV